MSFTFYSTYYPPITKNFPITVDYSLSNKKKLNALKEHTNKIMVHSGNWWSMDEKELRNQQLITEKAKKILNIIEKGHNQARFMGYMSCNEQPIISNDSKDIIPYWLQDSKKMNFFLEESLDNANWALENQDFKTPLYCTLQVITEKQAEYYFQKALDSGHKYFSIGVSEFLKYPKYRYQGIEKLFEILKGMRNVIPKKYQIHFSGLSSFNLIPIFNYLGVNSCDGSTPVQSALAYGTVFNLYGKGVSASALKKELYPRLKRDNDVIDIYEGEKLKGALGWFRFELDGIKCECDICIAKSKKKIIKIFNEGSEFYKKSQARVVHNLYVWNRLINDMNLNMRKDPKKWIDNFVNRDNSPYLNKVIKIAKKIMTDRF